MFILQGVSSNQFRSELGERIGLKVIEMFSLQRKGIRPLLINMGLFYQSTIHVITSLFENDESLFTGKITGKDDLSFPNHFKWHNLFRSSLAQRGHFPFKTLQQSPSIIIQHGHI